MANLTRLSVLIGDADLNRGRELIALLKQLGVRHAVHVHALAPLLETLKKQAFDVLLCAERLGADDGVAVLRAALEVAPATRSVLLRTNARAGGHVPESLAVVELPFSRTELQVLLHRTAAPHGGVWCEVPELSLTDILQMYHQARRSITVLLSGPIAGRIWLEAGDIVDAQANGERGMEALSYLLASESGLLRTEPHQGHVSRTISAPFQSAILEAAHKLDERRRDSLSSTPVGSYPKGSTTSQFPGSQLPSEHDRTSTSGSMLRPAMTPPIEAPSPNVESFLVPGRRRRRRTRWVALLSVLFSVASAALVASYLRNRLGTSQGRLAPETPQTAKADPRANADSRFTIEPSEANPVRAPVPPAREPAAAGREGGVARESAPSSNEAAQPAPTPRVPAPAQPVPASFELRISSKPPRATVSEGKRVLGKTPLRLTIGKSGAGGLREFILRFPGYFPVKISQAASDSDVDAAVVLTPLPAVVEPSDAGTYDPQIDPGDPESARSSNPKAHRKDLGIRTRR